MTCYKCGEMSDGRREIIACEYCPFKWHLDCLDPPMASAPKHKRIINRDPNEPPPYPEKERERARDRVGWMCPLHVDGELANLGNTGRGYSFENPTLTAQALAGGNVRLPKLRRPKQSKIQDTAMQRGFRNNGLIEIDNLPDNYTIGQINDNEMNGVVYRIPEYGLRLDFIERAKR
jgi:hypothetical protein